MDTPIALTESQPQPVAPSANEPLVSGLGTPAVVWRADVSERPEGEVVAPLGGDPSDERRPPETSGFDRTRKR